MPPPPIISRSRKPGTRGWGEEAKTAGPRYLWFDISSSRLFLLDDAAERIVLGFEGHRLCAVVSSHVAALVVAVTNEQRVVHALRPVKKCLLDGQICNLVLTFFLCRSATSPLHNT